MRPKAYLVVLGVIIAVVTASGAAEGQNQGLDQDHQSPGTVRIAVPDNFRPFGDHDTDGKLRRAMTSTPPRWSPTRWASNSI